MRVQILESVQIHLVYAYIDFLSENPCEELRNNETICLAAIGNFIGPRYCNTFGYLSDYGWLKFPKQMLQNERIRRVMELPNRKEQTEYVRQAIGEKA